MSYRDLRNFTEMMRALGYPRLISMENFRNPNFPLVAEVLLWLVKRYDPGADIPTDFETEQDRVMLIRSVAHFMATKAHIKLNTKKLYTADGYAVKELLKITTLLYEALKIKLDSPAEGVEESNINFNYDLTTKLSELKVTRKLASDITTKGASLYDLLAKETDLRDVRSNVIGRQLEISEIENGLRNAIKGVEEEVKKINHLIENVASDEANLEAKIEKRKTELERNQKRLLTLKSVRPAFMDEYERLEEDLERAYEKYLIKFRCLAFLEQQLEELEKSEQEQVEEREQQVKKMVELLRQDEMLRNDGDDDNFEDAGLGSDTVRGRKPKRPQPAASGVRRDGRRRVFGTMTGSLKQDSENELSDSDLDLQGDEEASDLSDDNLSDDNGELEDFQNERAALGLGQQNSFLQDSDNDF